jgi:hypothetical protein
MPRETVTEERTDWYTFHELAAIYGLEGAATLGQHMIQTGRAQIQLDGSLRFPILTIRTFTREVMQVQPRAD